MSGRPASAARRSPCWTVPIFSGETTTRRRPPSRRGTTTRRPRHARRRNPPATTFRGLSRHPPARASIPSGLRSSAPTTRRTKPGWPASARNARREWARQDARDRQDETARTPARDARANDRRPTRADRARQERAGHRATPDPQTRTTGHRREHAARAHDPEARHRPRRSRTERTRDAVADVGLYRAVSYTDLSDQHFDGHPYATRRSVNHMIRAGLIEEHEATGPQGNTFTVLTATERGRDAAQRAAVDAGHVPEQQTWSGIVKPAELSHDTAVYRAALDERARIEAAGGRVVRVRIDAELKATVATATEKARAEGGDRAARRGEAHSRARPRVARRQPRSGAVSRRAARHRGRRWCERARERRDCVRPLPRGGDRGEGRRRLCHARQQPIRHPEDRPRAGARKPTVDRAAARHAPAAMDRWSCRRCSRSPWPSG